MKMFYTLIMVMIILVQTFIKTHLIDYLQCILLYINYITIKLTFKKNKLKEEEEKTEKKEAAHTRPISITEESYFSRTHRRVSLAQLPWWSPIEEDCQGKICGVYLVR